MVHNTYYYNGTQYIIYLSINNHNVLVNKSYYKKYFNINNSISNKRGNAQPSTNQSESIIRYAPHSIYQSFYWITNIQY